MPGEKLITFNLCEAAKKEWQKRKALEKTARTENELKAAQLNSGDGAVPFDNFELLNIPIFDVDKLYLDYINDIMKKDRHRRGPTVLNLKEFELNLRQYRVVGGIYCLDYFEQPEQSVKLSAKSYLRTSWFRLIRHFSKLKLKILMFLNCFNFSWQFEVVEASSIFSVFSYTGSNSSRCSTTT